MKPYILKQKPQSYIVKKTIEIDDWIAPEFIWEVQADNFSLSELYPIGKGIINKKLKLPKDVGLSLRFPRFIRER